MDITTLCPCKLRQMFKDWVLWNEEELSHETFVRRYSVTPHEVYKAFWKWGLQAMWLNRYVPRGGSP